MTSLKLLYQSHPANKKIFDYLISFCKQNREETKVKNLVSRMRKTGFSINRDDVITLFKELEKIGLGKYIQGKNKRFKSYKKLTDIAAEAKGSEENCRNQLVINLPRNSKPESIQLIRTT